LVVLEMPVLAERLAVVGGEDDQRVAREAELVEPVEERPDRLGVHAPDARIVQALDEADVAGVVAVDAVPEPARDAFPRGLAHFALRAQAVDGVEHAPAVVRVEEADVLVRGQVRIVDIVGVVEDEEALTAMAPERAERAPPLPAHGVEVEALVEAARG